MDHDVDPSEFKATISVDPGVNDAIVAVEPSEASIVYMTDMSPKELIGSVSDSELTEDLRVYLEYLAEENEMSLAQVISILGHTGTYRYTASDLEPETEYIAFAYAIDANTGKALSPVTRQEFKTLEAGEPTEDYLAFIGTWTVTSAESNNGGPLSFEVTFSQRIPNSSYYMTGWTDLEEYKTDKVAVKFKASSKSVAFANFQDYGSLGEGEEGDVVTRYYMGYTAYEGDAPVMPVGGDYDAMTGTLQSDGSINLVGYQGTLTTGDTFTIIGLEFFGRDNKYVYFLPFGEENPTTNYAKGPYTMVKSTTPAAKSQIVPMQHRRVEKPGKIGMSFSSTTRMVQQTVR